jgi:hypothetical protein
LEICKLGKTDVCLPGRQREVGNGCPAIVDVRLRVRVDGERARAPAYALSAWVRGGYVYLGIMGGASTWTPSAAAYTRPAVGFTTGPSQTSVRLILQGWCALTDLAEGQPGGSSTPTGLAVSGGTGSSISPRWNAVSARCEFGRIYRLKGRSWKGSTVGNVNQDSLGRSFDRV